MAKNFKKPERISIVLRMSFKRRHKGAEGTNDRGKADECGWFIPKKAVLESAQNVSQLVSFCCQIPPCRSRGGNLKRQPFCYRP